MTVSLNVIHCFCIDFTLRTGKHHKTLLPSLLFSIIHYPNNALLTHHHNQHSPWATDVQVITIKPKSAAMLSHSMDKPSDLPTIYSLHMALYITLNRQGASTEHSKTV
jgi:hypothetical protein